MPVDPLSGRSAGEIIRLLDLHSRPKGGFFRNLSRSGAGGPGRLDVDSMVADILCTKSI
jgi:predicted cupin superfamily sugar epimerase